MILLEKNKKTNSCQIVSVTAYQSKHDRTPPSPARTCGLKYVPGKKWSSFSPSRTFYFFVPLQSSACWRFPRAGLIRWSTGPCYKRICDLHLGHLLYFPPVRRWTLEPVNRPVFTGKLLSEGHTGNDKASVGALLFFLSQQQKVEQFTGCGTCEFPFTVHCGGDAGIFPSEQVGSLLISFPFGLPRAIRKKSLVIVPAVWWSCLSLHHLA